MVIPITILAGRIGVVAARLPSVEFAERQHTAIADLAKSVHIGAELRHTILAIAKLAKPERIKQDNIVMSLRYF